MFTLFTPEDDVTGGPRQPTNQRLVISQPILGAHDGGPTTWHNKAQPMMVGTVTIAECRYDQPRPATRPGADEYEAVMCCETLVLFTRPV